MAGIGIARAPAVLGLLAALMPAMAARAADPVPDAASRLARLDGIQVAVVNGLAFEFLRRQGWLA